MINEILHETNDRMQKTIDSLQVDLMSIRTGRASPALVDRLQIDYYGTPTPLLQVAAISVSDAQSIIIRPYSPSDIAAIEKAIANSNLGLTPNNDGKQIRLNIPTLTEERRRDLSKQVSRRAEDARVAVRNIRRDAINDLRSFEKESMISEDDLRRGQDQVQEQTDDHTKQIDTIAREKESEIMTL